MASLISRQTGNESRDSAALLYSSSWVADLPSGACNVVRLTSIPFFFARTVILREGEGSIGHSELIGTMDFSAKRIMGWRGGNSMKIELVLDALEQALQPRAYNLIHQSLLDSIGQVAA